MIEYKNGVWTMTEEDRLNLVHFYIRFEQFLVEAAKTFPDISGISYGSFGQIGWSPNLSDKKDEAKLIEIAKKFQLKAERKIVQTDWRQPSEVLVFCFEGFNKSRVIDAILGRKNDF